MKKISCLVIVYCLFTGYGFAQTSLTVADKIIGLYWSPKKDAKIEIYKKGDQYFGKFNWITPASKDVKNPDVSLRNRDVLGMEFMTGFKYDEGDYTNGRIYDPQSGKTYDCKMSLNGDNLKVRGYVGFSMFGRTEVFTRVK